MSVNTKVNGQLVPSAGLYSVTKPIGIADIYSTKERQVGVWVDGKPLYQKTIDFGTLPNNASKSVAHGIANIEEVIDYECLAYSTSNGYHLAIPYVNKTNPNQYNIQFDIDATNINIVTSADRTVYDICRVTLKYTKTTDTPTTLIPSSASAIYMMGDVAISSVQDGQMLVYNSTTKKWENRTGGGGGASALDDLNDVTITSATQGQVLKKGASDWENASLSKSDVGLGNVDNTSDLNKPISTATQTALNAKENASTVLTSTLSAGSTSLTFSNAAITITSMYDIYADKYGLTPTNISITTGQAVLTFEAQSSNVSVKLVIR